MEYRIEHDSLGEVQVPTNRYWAAQTQRSFENFKIGSEKIPLDVIKAFAILKKSASVANRNLGKLDDERQKIISAVCEIRDCEIASHLQSYTLAILQSSFGCSKRKVGENLQVADKYCRIKQSFKECFLFKEGD